MKTQTQEIQNNLTPKCAHDILVEGNKRFVQNLKAQRNLQEQVFETSEGQFPFAVILSCIDSRAQLNWFLIKAFVIYLVLELLETLLMKTF